MSVVVTGLGCVLLGPGRAGDATCDPTSHLRSRKARKFMGVQDDLAVVAAARALASAGLGTSLGERAGLYLAVGYVPFEEEDMQALVAASVEEGELSMQRFSTDGLASVNPLLTFRCLSNMPAYHLSAAFDLQGPYVVAYPGVAQCYAVLEEAVAALEEERVDVALWGGVAHQRNMLVAHHLSRVGSPVAPDRLCDAGAVAVLEREEGAGGRGAPVRARLQEVEVAYAPVSPLEALAAHEERISGASLPGDAGAASLVVALALAATAGEGELQHDVASRDGVRASSRWSLAS